MNELFAFFIRHSKWFVYALLATVSCALLFRSDPYRQYLFTTSAGSVGSAVYGAANGVTSYFNLHEINDDLNRRNAQLQAEVESLKDRLRSFQEQNYTDTLVVDTGIRPFSFVVANVINNSISHPYNYLTINKGSRDGIRPELGVIDRNGVVGIVSNVGTSNARVISLLNPHFRLSCKLRSTEYFGSLVWGGDAPDEALLEELPRHTVFAPGDTVVTSGYSAVFPAGLPVGIVMDSESDQSQNFFTLRVKLLADFTTLSNVQIVLNSQADEIRSLSAGEENDSKKSPFGI